MNREEFFALIVSMEENNEGYGENWFDKNGIIQYAEVLESAGYLPNFDAVKSTLQNL